MGSRIRLSAAEHEQRAHRHIHMADALCDAGDEWAAVMYFYAAYHVMKAAFIADPIFDDPTRLSRISSALTMADRYVERHQGRRKPEREWGVNDLVGPLYGPDVMSRYEQLHGASIDVRYYDGLRAPLDKVREAAEWILDAYESGQLVAS